MNQQCFRYGDDRGVVGFTSIELLMVVAIVGIFAALLFPAISSVRDSARSVRCQSNFRQLGMACLLEANDHNGQVMWHTNAASVLWFTQLVQLGYRSFVAGNISYDEGVYQCPAAKNNPSTYEGGYGILSYYAVVYGTQAYNPQDTPRLAKIPTASGFLTTSDFS